MAHPGTAVITGASAGVGEATARRLAELGFEVVLVARRGARLTRIVRDIEASGRRAHLVTADLTNAEEASAAMRRAREIAGPADLLVNCIGTNIPDRALDSLSVANWDRLIATNLSAIFYCIHAVLPSMRERKAGLIVSISSLAGLQPSVLSGAAYSASKAGLNALSRSINLEEASRGIRSCIIAPGDIDTELLDQRPSPPDAEARKRMLRPEDVAELVIQVVRQPRHAIVSDVVVYPA